MGRALRVFENRFLLIIFGPKRDEVTRDWRKLHSEELHSLYPSTNIIRWSTKKHMVHTRQICLVLRGS
jgi:hypothetical protein